MREANNFKRTNFLSFLSLKCESHTNVERSPSDESWLVPLLKIIINGNQVLNPIGQYEALRKFRTEYDELLSFTSSSLTAGLGPPRGPELENPYRVPGTLVSDAHNFGILRFTGPRTDRVLTIECRDVQGKVRWTHTIKAKDLVVRED